MYNELYISERKKKSTLFIRSFNKLNSRLYALAPSLSRIMTVIMVIKINNVHNVTATNQLLRHHGKSEAWACGSEMKIKYM